MNCEGSHLFIIDHSASQSVGCDTAFQLAAELLRWPEHVASAVSSKTALPAITVTNKYFTAKVQIELIHASAQTGRLVAHSSGSSVQYILQQSPSSVGCVFVVEESTDPTLVLWHTVPAACLFRVVVLFAPSGTERVAMWYDACIENGFELVLHDIAYEVIPSGAESRGILSGDAKGAARLLQIMHNTMWPEVSRGTQRSQPNISTSGKSTPDPGIIHNSRGDSALPNVVGFIGVQGIEKIISWLAEAATDRRFFTAEWPPQSPSESVDTKEMIQGNENEDHANFSQQKKIKLALANSYYTALVEVQVIHPALLETSMVDLFVTQYSDRIPQLTVVSWPLTLGSPSHPKDTLKIPLPFLMDNIRRWGVGEIVVLAQSPHSLSSAELHYCESMSIEVVFMSDEPEDPNSNQTKDKEFVSLDEGTMGADRLAEILHMTSWPERRVLSATPNTTQIARNANRVLLWACAPTALEEETLLRSCLGACFAATPNQLDSVFSVASTGIDNVPAVTVNMRNKYFESNVLVYCHGGARSAIARNGLRTLEQMRAFAAIVILTTPCACGVHGHPSSTLSAALQLCSASAPKGSSLPLALDADPKSHADITQALCDESAHDVALLLYVSGAEDSDARLGACLDTLLLTTADAGEECSESAGAGSAEACVEPVEVVYGRSDGFVRVREAMEQHMWPQRAMREVRPHTVSHKAERTAVHSAESSSDDTKPAEVMRCEEGESKLPVATCALPPDYLIDPWTLRAQRVPALSGEKSKEAEIAKWADAMKRHGHRLPPDARRRQAEILAFCLGEHCCAGEEEREKEESEGIGTQIASGE